MGGNLRQAEEAMTDFGKGCCEGLVMCFKYSRLLGQKKKKIYSVEEVWLGNLEVLFSCVCCNSSVLSILSPTETQEYPISYTEDQAELKCVPKLIRWTSANACLWSIKCWAMLLLLIHVWFFWTKLPLVSSFSVIFENTFSVFFLHSVSHINLCNTKMLKYIIFKTSAA